MKKTAFVVLATAVEKTSRNYFAEAFEPSGGWTDQAELDRALKTITPTQLQVIGKLGETRSCMIRLHGGFWTHEGCGVNAAGIPSWWVTTATIQAMEKKGLLERSGFFVEEWKDHRVLANQQKGARS